MLISSFGHSVDAKGRVFIPAKWRDDLGDTVIITRDMMGNADSRCLYGMPVELWNAFEGIRNGIEYTLCSADHLDFVPKLITEI